MRHREVSGFGVFPTATQDRNEYLRSEMLYNSNVDDVPHASMSFVFSALVSV